MGWLFVYAAVLGGSAYYLLHLFVEVAASL